MLRKLSKMAKRFRCSFEVVFQTYTYRGVSQSIAECHGNTFYAFTQRDVLGLVTTSNKKGIYKGIIH